jgi:gliding motility-associated-like protein
MRIRTNAQKMEKNEEVPVIGDKNNMVKTHSSETRRTRSTLNHISMKIIGQYCLLFAVSLLIVFSGKLYAQPPGLGAISPAKTFYRTGETITINGINLWNGPTDCDWLEFTGPGILFYQFYSNIGAYTGTPSALTFVIPKDLVCATYSLRLAVDSCTSILYSNTITIDIRDSIGVSYPGTGIYCMGDANPIPISNLDTAYYEIFSGPSGAYVDSLTGEVAIQSGGIPGFTVRAFTSTNPTCNSQQTFNFTISNISNTTSFGYPPAPSALGHCPLDDSLVLSALPSPPGDSFRSIPAVTWTTQNLGSIDIDNTPPGNYTIIYVPPHDACAAQDTQAIKIRAKVMPIFNYDPTYCSGDSTAFPTVTVQPPGSYVSTSATPTGPLYLNSTTGAIDLVNSIPGAIYTVSYQPSGACAETVSDTFNILSTLVPFMEFMPDTVCTDRAFVGPDYSTLFPPVNTPGVAFQDTSGFVDIRIDSGQVDIGLSTPGGPYYVYYTNGDPVCPDTFYAPLTILQKDVYSISYPKSLYCENEGFAIPAFASGPTGGEFIFTAITSGVLNINDSTGVIDLMISDTGTYLIRYIAPNPDCADTIDVDLNFVIDGVGLANFNLPNGMVLDTLCEGSGRHKCIGIVSAGDTSGYVVMGPNGPFVGAVDVTDSIDTSVIPPGGPYPITRWVTNGICTDSVTHYITIKPREDASFYYVNDTLCGDATPPIPLITGNGGGTFSNDTVGFTNVTASTGQINLLAASGTFVIRYTTSGECFDTATDTITILPANSAEFHYEGEPNFCTFDSIILLDPAFTFVTGGRFTYTTAGTDTIDLDSLDGTIVLANSGTGTFSVRYSLTNAVCAELYTTRINIFASDDTTTMSYPKYLYCPTDSNPTPIVFGDQTGEFLSVPGINFLDSLGTISLNNSSSSSFPYFIRYRLPGDCPRDVVDSIEIQTAAPSDFTYSTDFFCSTDPNPIPDSITTPGGTFYVEDDFFDPVPFIDPITGEFFLDSVTGNNVKFYIYYNSGAGCTTESSQLITVYQGPAGASLFPDTVPVICEGQLLRFAASGSEVGYRWFRDNNQVPAVDLGSNQATYEATDFTTGTVVSVIFENLAGCQDSLARSVIVNDVPLIAISDTSITVSGDETVNIDVVSFLDNTFLDWIAVSQANVNFTSTSGFEGPVANGQTFPIQNQLGLTDSTSPALVIFTVTPRASGCDGEPIQVYVKVNPDNQAIFVPELITPNGDNLNDSWLIQWRNGIFPEDYTMLLYNRSGGLALRMNPLTQDFNGGSLPDGVYWYKLLDRTGNTLRTGGLTIRRK